MIVSEADARKKWCPLARVNTNNGCATNRYADEKAGKDGRPYNSMCIGSECMAWQQSPIRSDGDAGYCGLAAQ
jgi:hypothetical protein